ncbi:hypothetical protein DFH11DRAFT_1548204 [Phellopilus nigrolimitatus]|nr:hypothetical protein DFH11DRAFT_1548204 [Phellopilus nigrolimitatus]
MPECGCKEQSVWRIGRKAKCEQSRVRATQSTSNMDAGAEQNVSNMDAGAKLVAHHSSDHRTAFEAEREKKWGSSGRALPPSPSPSPPPLSLSPLSPISSSLLSLLLSSPLLSPLLIWSDVRLFSCLALSVKDVISAPRKLKCCGYPVPAAHIPLATPEKHPQLEAGPGISDHNTTPPQKCCAKISSQRCTNLQLGCRPTAKRTCISSPSNPNNDITTIYDPLRVKIKQCVHVQAEKTAQTKEKFCNWLASLSLTAAETAVGRYLDQHKTDVSK